MRSVVDLSYSLTLVHRFIPNEARGLSHTHTHRNVSYRLVLLWTDLMWHSGFTVGRMGTSTMTSEDGKYSSQSVWSQNLCRKSGDISASTIIHVHMCSVDQMSIYKVYLFGYKVVVCSISFHIMTFIIRTEIACTTDYICHVDLGPLDNTPQPTWILRRGGWI